MIVVVVLSVLAAIIVLFLVLRASPEETIQTPQYPPYTIDNEYAIDQSSESSSITVWANAKTTAM